MDDRPPRRRWFRRLVVYPAVLAAILAAVVWFAPVVVAKTSLKQKLIDTALADLDGRATVSGASFGWLSPVVLTGVTVTDPAGETVLTAESVTSSKTLLQLARNQSDLGTFTVGKPVVNLRCEPGATNVERLVAKYLADDGSAPKPTRPAVRLEVANGRVVQTEPGTPGETVLDPVDVTIVVPADRAEPVTLNLKAVAGGTLAADLELGQPVAGKLSADRFPLEAVGPVVRRFRPGTRATGTLTADLSGAGGGAASLHGRVGVSGLSLEAPWLGPDRLRLVSAELPLDIVRVGDEIEVRRAELTCDVGKLTASGRAPLDGTAEEYAGRAGLTAAADVDVAKLAALLPRLLRLKPGTALTDGKLTATVTSVAAADGTHWQGQLTTTAVRGTRDGRPLAWKQPLSAAFAGRLGADRRPVFDKLEARSDVAAVVAQGSVEKFAAAANIDLDHLAARLSEFADLGGWKLAGRAAVQVNGTTGSGGRFAAAGKAELTGFTATDAAGRGLTESAAVVTLRASGARDPAGPVRLEVGDIDIKAAGDEMAVKLVEPVADARSARSGRATATLTGDLARWRRRLAAFVALPDDWVLGGAGGVTAEATLTDAGLKAVVSDLNFRDVRFRGAGVELVEPTLTGKAGALTWDRASGAVAVADAWVSCPTATLNTAKFDVSPTLAGTVNVVGSVNRLTTSLKLPVQVDGVVRGPVGLAAGGRTFTADLKIDQFVYGPPARPTWREPWVKLRADGELAGDALKFRTLAVERDGATAEASGSLASLSTTPTADLAGTLTYDLARFEPQMRDYLGAGATVSGRGQKPFRLTGPLGGSLDQLAGEAAVGWQAVKAYGFDVGPAELKATLARGRLDLSPVQANFGGGTVRVDPLLDLTAADLPLSFAKGTIIDHAKLTPKATAGALGYALPAVANAAQADGTVSFQLDDNRIPLANPDAASLRGKLVLHDANLTAGPVFAQVLTLLEANTTAVTIAKEQVVPVAVDRGRVYHENFALTFGQTVVKSKGSVGLADQSLQLELELPIPPRAIDGLLKNNPRILEALKKQTIRVPVGGTLNQPRLDKKAFDAAVGQVVRGATKDATRGFLGDALKGGLGELQKKFEPKQP